MIESKAQDKQKIPTKAEFANMPQSEQQKWLAWEEKQSKEIPIVDPFPPIEEPERRHCGFEAPVIGTLLPKGTKWKQNPDGTSTPIYPEQDKSK